MFSRVAQKAMLSILFRPDINIQILETYWEFSVFDPLSWIHSVEPTILAIGQNVEARDYQYRDGLAAVERIENSRRLKVQLRSGSLLRLYAKTNRRIRFEIEHNFQTNARPLGTSHTSSNLNDFLHWVLLASQDAAHQINNVLQRMQEADLQLAGQASVVQLIIAATQAVGDKIVAQEILLILAANQSVTNTTGFALQRAVRRLVACSILEPLAPKSRTYVLAYPYRRAGRRLQGALVEKDVPPSLG